MNDGVMSYTMHTIHLCEATLDEEDSYNYLSTYNSTHQFNYNYVYPDHFTLDDIHLLTSNYSLFYAKLRDKKSEKLYQFNQPIHVFRYIMKSDGTWGKYYAVRPDIGYVVEGMYWSNGMMYQVRENTDNFVIHQIVLSVDSLTKTMYSFPETS